MGLGCWKVCLWLVNDNCVLEKRDLMRSSSNSAFAQSGEPLVLPRIFINFLLNGAYDFVMGYQ